MVLWVLRALFIVLISAVGFSAVGEPEAASTFGRYRLMLMVGAICVAVAMIAVDVFMPRKSLAALSGVFLGLVVGMVVAYGLGLILDLIIEAYAPDVRSAAGAGVHSLIVGMKLMIGLICCYLSISFILQTKDDVRFVIPYVEFAKQSRGTRPLILDTSVIIDGRIADICDTRIIDSPLLIPRFVLQELQTIADSSDKLKRNRGRRGLDMLNKLQTNDKVEIKISDMRLPSVEEAGAFFQGHRELAEPEGVEGRGGGRHQQQHQQEPGAGGGPSHPRAPWAAARGEAPAGAPGSGPAPRRAPRTAGRGRPGRGSCLHAPGWTGSPSPPRPRGTPPP